MRAASGTCTASSSCTSMTRSTLSRTRFSVRALSPCGPATQGPLAGTAALKVTGGDLLGATWKLLTVAAVVNGRVVLPDGWSRFVPGASTCAQGGSCRPHTMSRHTCAQPWPTPPPGSACIPVIEPAGHASCPESGLLWGHWAPCICRSGRASHLAVSLVVPESPGASPFICLPVPPRLQQPLSFAASVVCIFQNIVLLKSWYEAFSCWLLSLGNRHLRLLFMV